MIADSQLGQKVEETLKTNSPELSGKVVGDWLALRLLLRRSLPEALVIELDDDTTMLRKLIDDPSKPLAGVRIVGLRNQGSNSSQHESISGVHAILNHDFTEQQLRDAVMSSDPIGTGHVGETKTAADPRASLELQPVSASPSATNFEG